MDLQHLLVYRFVSLVSCGSTWLTGYPRPWVELGIALLFHSFTYRLSGLESHHCFITYVSLCFISLFDVVVLNCW
ncbi:hypothetical protein Hanom_Chr06g00531261 [Helianthus anomalus]